MLGVNDVTLQTQAIGAHPVPDFLHGNGDERCRDEVDVCVNGECYYSSNSEDLGCKDYYCAYIEGWCGYDCKIEGTVGSECYDTGSSHSSDSSLDGTSPTVHSSGSSSSSPGSRSSITTTSGVHTSVLYNLYLCYFTDLLKD